MALIVTFLGLLAVIAFAPGTPAERFLHRALVELPARALTRVSRGHVAVAVGLVAALAIAFWLIDEELAFVMTLMAPEALVYVAMFDVATYIDVAVAVALASNLLRVRAFIGFLRHRLPVRSPRARKSRRPQRQPANDDEDRRFALAA